MMEAAYSNVGLDANATWRDGPGDAFQKCSDKLWVQLNYLKEKKHHQVGKGKTVTVRDVIPQSKLARYGNFAYDNEREFVYTREKAWPRFRDRSRGFPNENETATEPWMHPEVEREFERLTRNRSRPYDLYNGFRPVELVEVEESIGKKYPVLAKKCQPNVVDSEETLETICLPNPFYRIEDLKQLELQMRITSTKHVWEQSRQSKTGPTTIASFSTGEVPSDRSPETEDKNSIRARLGGFLRNGGERSPLPVPFLVLPPRLRPPAPASAPVFLPCAYQNHAESIKIPFPRNIRTPMKNGPCAERRDFLPELPSFTGHGHFQKVPETVIKWLHTCHPSRRKQFRAVHDLTEEFRNLRTTVNNTLDNKELPSTSYVSPTPEILSEPMKNHFLEYPAGQTENLNASRGSSSGSGGVSVVGKNRRGSPFSNLTYSPISSASLPDFSSSSSSSSLPEKTCSESNSSPDTGYDDLERQAIEQWPSDDSFQKSITPLRIIENRIGGNAVASLAQRMTTKMRHPHSTPLRTITVGRNNLPRGIRPSNTAKRKSAVELLQETKAFYVKSETVLDKKQEFRPTRSPDSYMAPSQPAKSPRCSQYGSELQDRLRILLDFDSKENMDTRTTGRYGEKTNYRKGCDRGICLSQSQHKSLPDLHVSPGRSSTDTSESSYEMRRSGTDSRSAYSSATQPEYGSVRGAKRLDFRRSGYAVDDVYGGNDEFAVSDPRIYASLRVTKSGEFVSPRTTEAQTYYWRRNSNTSSGNRSQHNSSSRHSQSADSGRQSQGGSGGLRTGRSGLPDAASPPPPPFRDPESDSGAEDESPPLYRTEACGERDKKRPVLRSKSDISYRYCANRPMSTVPPPALLTTDRLEKFFDHLGMDPVDYREMAAWNSRCSSPIFFSSVSSIDSCMDLTSWGPPEPEKPAESPSIVEKNARIIKWLCNCRKAQATRLTLV